MESKIIRVLHITEVLEAAGIESFIMNIYRNIDRKLLQFDFMVMRDKKEYYDDEIKRLGGIKYTINCQKYKNVLLRVLSESIDLYKFLKNSHYDVIHIHTCTPLRVFYLLAAKKAGVVVRIYHSHSAAIIDKKPWKKRIFSLLRIFLNCWATDFFACSKAAGKWMFSTKKGTHKEYKIINNGIETDKYKYDLSARQQIRHELHMKTSFIVGNIGRFIEQKNQSFVIDVFKEIKHIQPTAQLILLGKGPLEHQLKQYSLKSGLNDSIHFLNIRNDVNKLLSAMDLFLMPSLYEGLPVSAIEAQCSGVFCVLSNNITEEVVISSDTKQISLECCASEWAQNILQSMKNTKANRENAYSQIKEAGYDVKDVAKELQQYYIAILKKYSNR